MHFDRLDERYTMVKSNLQLEQFSQTGLTGLETGLPRFANFDCQQLSCHKTYAVSIFLSKFNWHHICFSRSIVV